MQSWRAALFCTALIFAAPAAAEEIDWGDTEIIVDADMAEMRGGFIVSPGLEVNFGAMVTTFVNGSPALQTQLTWTDLGAVVERSVGALGQRIDALSPEARADLGLDGLEGAGGVVINDADGVTALVHNITDGALQNIIVNNASGRDLRQHVDVTLTLPGFEAVQASLVLERFGMRLTDDLQSVIIGPTGR